MSLYVSPCFSSLLGFISSLPQLAWDKRLCCCCCCCIHLPLAINTFQRAPIAPNHYEHRVWAQDHAPNSKEEAGASRCGRWPPQAISRHSRPNSVGRIGTVLLDHRATTDRGSVNHTACQEGMERHGQVVALAFRTSDEQGIMTKDGDAHL
jgi:hypothetical protein